MLALTQENAARTCHSAYCHALGRRDTSPAHFDERPEVQNLWMKFAEIAPRHLNTAESGGLMSELAEKIRRELYEIPPEDKEAPPRPEALAWQAATWHLAKVIDNADDLTAEKILEWERYWRQWADKRTIKLGVR